MNLNTETSRRYSLADASVGSKFELDSIPVNIWDGLHDAWHQHVTGSATSRVLQTAALAYANSVDPKKGTQLQKDFARKIKQEDIDFAYEIKHSSQNALVRAARGTIGFGMGTATFLGDVGTAIGMVGTSIMFAPIEEAAVAAIGTAALVVTGSEAVATGAAFATGAIATGTEFALGAGLVEVSAKSIASSSREDDYNTQKARVDLMNNFASGVVMHPVGKLLGYVGKKIFGKKAKLIKPIPPIESADVLKVHEAVGTAGVQLRTHSPIDVEKELTQGFNIAKQRFADTLDTEKILDNTVNNISVIETQQSEHKIELEKLLETKSKGIAHFKYPGSDKKFFPDQIKNTFSRIKEIEKTRIIPTKEYKSLTNDWSNIRKDLGLSRPLFKEISKKAKTKQIDTIEGFKNLFKENEAYNVGKATIDVKQKSKIDKIFSDVVEERNTFLAKKEIDVFNEKLTSLKKELGLSEDVYTELKKELTTVKAERHLKEVKTKAEFERFFKKIRKRIFKVKNKEIDLSQSRRIIDIFKHVKDRVKYHSSTAGMLKDKFAAKGIDKILARTIEKSVKSEDIQTIEAFKKLFEKSSIYKIGKEKIGSKDMQLLIPKIERSFSLHKRRLQKGQTAFLKSVKGLKGLNRFYKDVVKSKNITEFKSKFDAHITPEIKSFDLEKDITRFKDEIGILESSLNEHNQLKKWLEMDMIDLNQERMEEINKRLSDNFGNIDKDYINDQVTFENTEPYKITEETAEEIPDIIEQQFQEAVKSGRISEDVLMDLENINKQLDDSEKYKQVLDSFIKCIG